MLQPKPQSLTFRGSPGQLVYLTIYSMVPRFPAYGLRCFRRWAAARHHSFITLLFASLLYSCGTDTIGSEILSNFDLLERAVDQFDARFTLRALRAISSIRKLLEQTALAKIILRVYLPNDNRANILLKAIGTDVEQAKEILHTADKAHKVEGVAMTRKTTIPEIDIYISILIQVCQVPNVKTDRMVILSGPSV